MTSSICLTPTVNFFIHVFIYWYCKYLRFTMEIYIQKRFTKRKILVIIFSLVMLNANAILAKSPDHKGDIASHSRDYTGYNKYRGLGCKNIRKRDYFTIFVENGCNDVLIPKKCLNLPDFDWIDINHKNTLFFIFSDEIRAGRIFDPSSVLNFKISEDNVRITRSWNWYQTDFIVNWEDHKFPKNKFEENTFGKNDVPNWDKNYYKLNRESLRLGVGKDMSNFINAFKESYSEMPIETMGDFYQCEIMEPKVIMEMSDVEEERIIKKRNLDTEELRKRKQKRKF